MDDTVFLGIKVIDNDVLFAGNSSILASTEERARAIEKFLAGKNTKYNKIVSRENGYIMLKSDSNEVLGVAKFPEAAGEVVIEFGPIDRDCTLGEVKYVPGDNSPGSPIIQELDRKTITQGDKLIFRGTVIPE